MLTAVGIASEIISARGRFVLQVASADLEPAAAHLRQYELENPPRAGSPAASSCGAPEPLAEWRT